MNERKGEKNGSVWSRFLQWMREPKPSVRYCGICGKKIEGSDVDWQSHRALHRTTRH